MVAPRCARHCESKQMSDTTNLDEHALPKLSALELESIRPLQECARLQGTSVDTIVRDDARRVARGEKSRIVDLSMRRKGMRVKHALRLE
jgi:hypothetical protein